MAPTMAGETNRLSLDADSFADVIKMILNNFLKMILKVGRSSPGCLVVDIELIPRGDYHTVQITHCGRWTNQGIENLFNELCLLPNAVVAKVYERVDGGDVETTYDIEGGQNFAMRNNTAKNRRVHFPSFKNYVLIKLKHRLGASDLSEFKEILLREFHNTIKSHRDVKITFYSGVEVFYSNHVGSDDDFLHCQLLSLPIIDVIKQSMNNQFKERCLLTLNANGVNDAQRTLTRTLFSVTHENYVIP